MRDYQRSICIAVSTLLVVSAMAGCKDKGYKVTGDNKEEVSQYWKRHDSAITYLLKTTVYVGEVRSQTALPVGRALALQSKKMLELRSEGEAFGSFLSALSHCRGAGFKAQEYWLTVAGTISTQSPDEALNAYVKEAQGCQEQIDNPPQELTYIETPLDKNPPVDGCLKILSLSEEDEAQRWSCRSDILSKS